MTNSFPFRKYPEAIIAFEVELGERYRDLQEWLDESSDGFRDGRWCFFSTLECAEAFNDAYGDQIIYTAVAPPFEKSVRTVVRQTDVMAMSEDHAAMLRIRANHE